MFHGIMKHVVQQLQYCLAQKLLCKMITLCFNWQEMICTLLGTSMYRKYTNTPRTLILGEEILKNNKKWL